MISLKILKNPKKWEMTWRDAAGGISFPKR